MRSLKPTFFTSDWHIGHRGIIQFSRRPFCDVDQMASVLVENFNAAVPRNGICYFLGDMGVSSGEAVSEVLSRLNGTKVLVLGNHDNRAQAMYRAGFDVVVYGATVVVGGQVVTLTHCPLLGVKRENLDGLRHLPGEGWYGEYRAKNRKFSIKDDGQFHLHGHIHSPNGGRSERECGRQFDVGVDANDYRPVAVSTIESWIARTIKAGC